MERKKISDILSSVTVLLLALICIFSIINYVYLQKLFYLNQTFLSSNPVDEVSETIGNTFSNFELFDTSNNLRNLSDYLGSPIVLVFTSHTCSVCKILYPNLIKFSKSNPQYEIIIVTSNSVEENQAFIQEYDQNNAITLVVLQGNQQVFELYKITSTPTLFYIDSIGEIRNANHALTEEQIVELVNP